MAKPGGAEEAPRKLEPSQLGKEAVRGAGGGWCVVSDGVAFPLFYLFLFIFWLCPGVF